MKSKFWLYGAIAFVAISFLFSFFSQDKYTVMTKSHAASKFFLSGSRTELEEFCKYNRVISIEMDEGDYILIKYR